MPDKVFTPPSGNSTELRLMALRLSGLQFVQCFMTMPDISPFNHLIIFSLY